MSEDDTIYQMNYQGEGSTARRNSINILLKDFQRLEPSVYLNDTIVLFFLKFLQNFVMKKETADSVHIFNSFFMQMITANVQGFQHEMQMYNQMHNDKL